MTDTRPELPGDSQPPTRAQVAAAVAAMLPERDRAEGLRVLAEEVLPHELEALDTHPRPRRLAEIVLDGLAGLLAQAPPDQRLHRLQGRAEAARLQQAWRESTALAMARYLTDHPQAEERAGDWMDAAVQRWRGLPAETFRAEARARLAALDEWWRRVPAEHPDVGEAQRIYLLHARMAAEAAASGAFDAAAGSLADFLRDVGATFRQLELH